VPGREADGNWFITAKRWSTNTHCTKGLKKEVGARRRGGRTWRSLHSGSDGRSLASPSSNDLIGGGATIAKEPEREGGSEKKKKGSMRVTSCKEADPNPTTCYPAETSDSARPGKLKAMTSFIETSWDDTSFRES